MDSLLLVFTVAGFIGLLVFTGLFLFSYARKGTAILVLLVTGYSYLLCFTPVILLPIDIIPSADTKKDTGTLEALWSWIYWSGFVLTWVLLPILDKYYTSGCFDWKAKLKHSLRQNLVMYGIMVGLLVVFVLFVLISKSLEFDDLGSFLVLCANTWGMLMSVLLLGYGLVEVPRSYWYEGNKHIKLKYVQYRITQLYADLDNAKGELYSTKQTLTVLQNKFMGPRSAVLTPLLQVVRSKVPQYDLAGLSTRHLDRVPLLEELKKKSANDFTQDDMVKLHTAVLELDRKLMLADSQWKETIEQAIELEKGLAEGRVATGYSSWLAAFRSRHDSKFWKLLAGLFGLVSVLILWAECIVWLDNADVTVLGILLNVDSELVVVVSGLLLMLYFMYCGYLGLFKLSLGKLYGMHPNKRTDQSSLLFSGSLLLRVFSPLTYNFVTMYNLDADAFKGVVGNITVFPFFGEQFNQFLPILVAVVAVMNITNVFGKALKCIGVQFFERDESFEDDTIAEGKLLLRRAKHKLEVETETKSSDELSLL